MSELAPIREYGQERLLRVPTGSSLPQYWRFVAWVGKETNALTGQWEDVVLCDKALDAADRVLRA